MSVDSEHDFPSTQYMWIRDHLEGGPAARDRLLKWAMEVYARPLETYARATGLARSSHLESNELVNGFLASVLSRQGYLQEWVGSGLRLRQWFRNGLHFHAKTMRRESTRGSAHPGDAEAEPMVATSDAERLLDREWATTVVEGACQAVREELLASGKTDHWELFWRHHIEGIPYAQLVAERSGLNAGQAATRCFDVATRLRERLTTMLVRDGVPSEEVTRELRQLMESIRT